MQKERASAMLTDVGGVSGDWSVVLRGGGGQKGGSAAATDYRAVQISRPGVFDP